MIHARLACILEGCAWSVELVLLIGMRCKNLVDNLAKQSVVCKRTLCHFADRPQDALPSVASSALPCGLERIVHQQPGLVWSRGQCTVATRVSGEEWGLENVNWSRWHQVLGLEVIAKIEASLRIVAKLYGDQDAQHILGKRFTAQINFRVTM